MKNEILLSIIAQDREYVRFFRSKFVTVGTHNR